MKLPAMLLAALVLGGCAATPPAEPENLCAIFKEKRDWYQAARRTQQKWGTPPQVPMAIMYQESSFRHNAAPPRKYLLGVIPLGRVSSAYGYSQAKTITWDGYVKATGNRGADRDDFDDAMDFIGWYTYQSHKINGVSKWDAYNQYLNYHEGWGGFKRKTYAGKPWLIKTSKKVAARASRYGAQLKQCQKELDRGWLSRILFG